MEMLYNLVSSLLGHGKDETESPDPMSRIILLETNFRITAYTGIAYFKITAYRGIVYFKITAWGIVYFKIAPCRCIVYFEITEYTDIVYFKFRIVS